MIGSLDNAQITNAQDGEDSRSVSGATLHG